MDNVAAITVFTGPSLSPAEAQHYLPKAQLCGPAGQGDIYRAALQQPHAIALIDGVFENQPAVWHKEILFALHQGIHVFGASSMGALRAAELSAYGMQGMGKIFNAFHCNDLEDDDEVTITHAPEAFGYTPTSEAMVNIRETLSLAKQKNIICSQAHDALLTRSKQRWYPKRHFNALLNDAHTLLAEAPHAIHINIEQLEALLRDDAINQKQRDAIELLQHINAIQADLMIPAQYEHPFVNTDAWQGLVNSVHIEQDQQLAQSIDGPLTELKLAGQYSLWFERAKERSVCVQTHRLNSLSAQQKQHTLVAFCQNNQLVNTDQSPDLSKVQTWLAQQSLSLEQFDQLIERQAQSDSATRGASTPNQQLHDLLTLNQQLTLLQQKHAHKQEQLQRAGLAHITLADTHLKASDLIQWYFCDVLRTPIPNDLSTYCQHNGFNSVSTFKQQILEEYLYQCLIQEASGSHPNNN